MTLLNTQNDGHPALLRGLVRTLGTLSPDTSIPKRDLEALFAPTTAPLRKHEQGNFAAVTLGRWTRLQLFSEREGERVEIGRAYRPLVEQYSERLFRRSIRSIVFEPSNNAPFWADSDEKSANTADLTRALAWFFLVDGVPLGTGWDAAEKRLRATMRPDAPLTPRGQVRWSGFKAWTSMLGFGWENGRTFVPDPTVAITDELPEVFQGSPSLDQATFLQRAATRLPVLDQGTYRAEFLQNLREESLGRPGEAVLSPGLSRALLRLQASGVLHLERKSDSKLCFLTSHGGEEIAQVSHFTWNGQP